MSENEIKEMQSIRGWMENNKLCGDFNRWQKCNPDFRNSTPIEQYREFYKKITTNTKN